MADPKAYNLEIFRPGQNLRFVFIYMRTVKTQTSMRISRLGPATETKSDRSEFIVSLVLCKRIKRNVWWPIRTHTSLSSSQCHVNSYPLRFGAAGVAPGTFHIIFSCSTNLTCTAWLCRALTTQSVAGHGVPSVLVRHHFIRGLGEIAKGLLAVPILC